MLQQGADGGIEPGAVDAIERFRDDAFGSAGFGDGKRAKLASMAVL